MKNQFRSSMCAAVLLILTSLFTNLQAQTFNPKYVSIAQNSGGYYEYLPQGYSSTGSETYPVIIFFHGIGEKGDGKSAALPLILKAGLPKLISQGKFPTSFTVNGKTSKFIVIAAQFATWPGATQVGQIIDYATKNYKADASRIYVTGLSMGGAAVWDGATSTANIRKIAAIVPISGARAGSTTGARTIASNNLPVWALHNESDPTVVSSYTKNWITYINTAPAPNPLARKTIFAASGHDAWTKSYDPAYREDGKNVYEWMLQYTTSRGAASAPVANVAPKVNAGTDRTITLPVNTVQLAGTASDADGSISKYAWTVTSGPSGSSFSSATVVSPSIKNLVKGSYTLRLTVTDNKSATAYDEVKITVNTASVTVPAVPSVPSVPSSGSNKYIKVKIYGGANGYSNTEWNNWNVGTAIKKNVGSSAFTYSDKTVSNIKATLSYTGGMGDNGTGYAGGMAPKEVLRHTSFATTSRTLTLTGLTPGKKYDIELYASRGSNAGNSTKFIKSNLSKTITTQNNYTNKATFSGLVPDASGKIVVSLERTKTYTYLNGFMLTEGSSTATASVAKMAAASEEVVAETAIEATPAATEDRTALKLNNSRTGQFDVAVTDMHGNVVKEMLVNKSQTGLSQSYISLKGLTKGQYIVIATQHDYSEAVLVNKF